MKLRRSDEMTAADLLWAPAIPNSWRVERLKNTVRTSKNGVWGDEPDGEHDLPCVRVADFDRVKFRAAEAPTLRAIPFPQRSGRLLRRGDLLIEKSGGGDQQPVGTVVVYDADEPAVCSNFVGRIEVAAGNDSRFLAYLHAALYAAGINTRSIKQTTGIQNLDSTSYFDERVPLPCVGEQRAISAFLDGKTAAIDALIAKKERLIELLEEKRQALITHAVTKGLDPSVPMKDSGIEWLGPIPAHWRVARLKFLVREKVAGPYGSSLTKAMYTSSGYRVYGQQQVIPNDFSVGDYYISDEKYAEMRRYTVHPGDLLVSVMGTVGRVAVVPHDVEPGIINPRLVRYRPDAAHVSAEWLRVVLMSRPLQMRMLEQAQGSTMDGLNMVILGELPMLLPSLDEQRTVLAHVARAEGHAEATASRIRTQLHRLREYRQALITAAVTGKIDLTAEPK